MKLNKLFLLLILTVLGNAWGQDPKPLQVCAVLGGLSKYNGKVIVVRGPIIATDEGAWFDGSTCKTKLISDGFEWRMLIWLEMSRAKHTAEEFEALLKSTTSVDKQVQLTKFNPEKDRLWLTITGVLVTHNDLAGHRGEGFGHMNSAPAEVIVQRESDPLIQHGVGKGSALR